MTTTAIAYAAPAAKAPLEKTTITRRELGPHDVAIDIAYAGICHSDIHTVRDEWGQAHYPLTPGHEISGHVTAVGADVSRYAVGDRVGVGVMVDSCRECPACRDGEENYCEEGMVGTYDAELPNGEITQGGYSTAIVVDENYVLRIPEGLDLDAAAPLLCAGITVYSPLRHWKAGPGTRVAVIGLGGLGHMAVKFAAALGAEVTVLSQSLSKEADGRRMGAAHYYATNDPATFETCKRSFDLIINTVSANLDIDDYLELLDRNGTLVEVGLPENPIPVKAGSLINPRVSLSGSMIGGIAETQEMLDFAAAHGLASEIEVISGEQINEAYDRVVASDVRFRFVIDIDTLRTAH
ncbi:NAD(P)-dependent alcohol dehydrogenase [Microlunatus panaciterrae]|uniref:alcohol dehydrogenase (NADP(+)) n=1 Tax=Microlunatus panaciterrae TaxID=400768 RepID=A0ABS2RK09_9ACTN|nr:NAD(P)-dependent alcohol dehydrogenase [Microlunatus panaciterrae]MBM7799341.1 putative zinc-type alcohol dehydrogenase-like protein [Microlunatus panaciterrae]